MPSSSKSIHAQTRPRCPDGCGAFLHVGKPCPKRGGSKPRLTLEQRRSNDRAGQKRWRDANKDRVREMSKRDRVALRLRVLSHYSGDALVCSCCGEATFEFLTLDHIDGGGNDARRTEGHRGGTAQYRALARAGFPPGYRVLCWNCNAALGLYGECPHDKMKEMTA